MQNYVATKTNEEALITNKDYWYTTFQIYTLQIYWGWKIKDAECVYAK